MERTYLVDFITSFVVDNYKIEIRQVTLKHNRPQYGSAKHFQNFKSYTAI
jgi:hypothetical protein